VSRGIGVGGKVADSAPSTPWLCVDAVSGAARLRVADQSFARLIDPAHTLRALSVGTVGAGTGADTNVVAYGGACGLVRIHPL
jgi:hypothetical protein